MRFLVRLAQLIPWPKSHQPGGSAVEYVRMYDGLKAVGDE